MIDRPPFRDYDGPWLDKWLAIGRANPWICEAADPPFTARMFSKCLNASEVFRFFQHGNWCLGQAFVLGEVCWINQVNGGDEWLTIRRDVPFESMTARRCFATAASIERFCRAVCNVTDADLRIHNYTWKE